MAESFVVLSVLESFAIFDPRRYKVYLKTVE
jgi:hypothetical protein